MLNNHPHDQPTPVAKPARPGVAVVVMVYRRSDHKLLIGKRKNAVGRGCWELPGATPDGPLDIHGLYLGSMEYGETFSQSCKREVEEETGLAVQSVQFICPKNIVFSEAQKHFVALFFAAECLQDDPIPVTQEPDKSEGWRWAMWAELRARKYAPLFGILDELVDEYPSEPWRMTTSGTF